MTSTQWRMPSRALFFAAIAAAVSAVAVRELMLGSFATPMGFTAVSLVSAVAITMFVAAVLDHSGRATAASLLVAGLAYVSGPTFAYVYADPGAAAIAPLVGFALALPQLRRPGFVVVIAGLSVLVAVANVWLLELTIARATPAPGMIDNALVSIAAIGSLVVYLQISQRRALQAAAREYEDLFNGLPIGAFRSTPDGRLLAVNDALVEMYGYRNREELLRTPALELYRNPQDRATAVAGVDGQDQATGELQVRRRDGTPVQIRYHARPERDRDGRVAYYEGAVVDVTAEHRAANWERERQEITSALRSLAPSQDANALARAICTAIVQSPHFPYAAIFAVHADGSFYLHGGWLRSTLLEPALLEGKPLTPERQARALEGAWVEPMLHPTTELGRRSVADDVRDLAWLPLMAGETLVGMLVAGTGTGDADLLSERLPEMNHFAAVSSALMGPALLEERAAAEVRGRIERVLTEGSFRPVFQPIVNLRSGRVLGYEALTRFADGSEPDLMFASAASCELGMELELAAIDAAMAAIGELPRNQFLDINVSPALVQVTDLLLPRLAAWPSKIVVEITEHVRIDDYPRLRSAIAALGPKVQLSVDDAGAGFASMRHILELKPQFVKLDRDLVRDIDTEPARQALAAGMAHFARQSGVVLIAEGVETEAERRTLIKLGVGTGQGYLLGRPAPVIAAVPARRSDAYPSRSGSRNRSTSSRRSRHRRQAQSHVSASL